MSLVLKQTPLKIAKYHKRPLSLSTYFPAGTQYFYGYPAGEESGFFNQVPPVVEELVAARATACAGRGVSVVSFAATQAPQIDPAVLQAFAIPAVDPEQRVVLPLNLDRQLEGAARNQYLKQCLTAATPPGSLVMAQPFTGEEMVDYYQIPAKLTTWLNDKHSLPQFIHRNYLPERLAVYGSGEAFATGVTGLTLPFVVKASSSSAGDGVFICHSSADVAEAIDNLGQLAGTVLVESYINTKHNFGVHFGIPERRTQAIDIIGINEQLTTPDGEFIGGVIRSRITPSQLRPTVEYIRNTVLPYIRDMGWYGVGCFDVLEALDGRFYIIDSNFRMTGMTAYHFLRANQQLEAPLLGFAGSFKGTQEELMQGLLPFGEPHSPSHIMQLIALNRDGDTWHFNAALLFEDNAQLWRRIRRLLIAGVRSDALEQMLGRLG